MTACTICNAETEWPPAGTPADAAPLCVTHWDKMVDKEINQRGVRKLVHELTLAELQHRRALDLVKGRRMREKSREAYNRYHKKYQRGWRKRRAEEKGH